MRTTHLLWTGTVAVHPRQEVLRKPRQEPRRWRATQHSESAGRGDAPRLPALTRRPAAGTRRSQVRTRSEWEPGTTGVLDPHDVGVLALPGCRRDHVRVRAGAGTSWLALGRSSGPVELARPHPGDERLPLTGGVDVRGERVVLRVADRHAAVGQHRDLDATGRVSLVPAEAALAPLRAAQVHDLPLPGPPRPDRVPPRPARSSRPGSAPPTAAGRTPG